MWKAAFIAVLVLHGLIHLPGFFKEAGLAPVPALSGETLFPLTKTLAQAAGLFWLLACLLFLAAAAGFVLQQSWWSIVALTAVCVSQLLVVLYWKDARWGTLINGMVLLIALISFAGYRFTTKVNSEVQHLLAPEKPYNHQIVTAAMLHHLPLPVQRWLQRSGMVGKEMIHTVRLQQKGWMRTQPTQTKWTETVAEQYFRVDDPAFIWRVKMNIMALPVSGRDAFVDGKGEMLIKLGSLVNMVHAAGEKIDQGALQRYLAEICWFPSAALSPYIHWQALNDTSVKATLTYKGVSGSVVFHFNQQGDLIRCSANRFMSSGKDAHLEKWEVTTLETAVRNGIRIPVRSEATWHLKEGDFTWYKLELTDIAYNKPQLYEWQ